MPLHRASASASLPARPAVTPARARMSCTFCAPASQSSITSARAPSITGGSAQSAVRPSARAVSPRARHSSSTRFSRTRLRMRAINSIELDRLGQEVVGAGLQAAHLLLRLVQRGDHHHRDVAGRRVFLQFAAADIAVHARHHDVEQDQVGLPGPRLVQRLEPVPGAGHLVIFSRELGFQQPRVGRDIIHDQDAGSHPLRCLPPEIWPCRGGPMKP